MVDWGAGERATRWKEDGFLLMFAGFALALSLGIVFSLLGNYMS